MNSIVNKKTSSETCLTPDSLVLFVTGRCNARCSHCFYADHLNCADDAIDKTVLAKMLESLTRPTAISLTGGEPFARTGFGKLLDQILVSPLIQSVSINSNGILFESIKQIITETLNKHEKPLHVQLSLDGLETTHDLIRRIPGGFRKTLSTAEWLFKHADGFSALSSTISSTVMRANLAEVEPLIEYLQNRGLRSKIAFVRGNSFSTFNVPDILMKKNYESSELPASVEELEGLVRRLTVRFPDFFDEYAHRKLTTAMLTLRKRSRHLPCFAGDRDGVVYHDGHVGICEQVLPFGHLSMWDWNLDSAWNSIEAQTHRKLLRQCACIHGCNLSTSVAMAMTIESKTES